MSRWIVGLILMVGAPVASADSWREVAPENLLILELPDGTVTIELTPRFAPQTVSQIRKLVRDGFYQGRDFYRVIDGFVAQGGAGEDDQGDGVSGAPSLAGEFQQPWDAKLPFLEVQQGDLFAPHTGFIDTFPAAHDGKHVWLTHCPGTVAMARGNEPDSGGSEFYIVIGQAPRYLDRNLTIFGRVIDGMPTVQRIKRGPADANGIIDDLAGRTPIKAMHVGADLTPSPRWQVMDSQDESFQAMVDGRRKRTHAFFHHRPPEVIDVCQVPLRSRKSDPQTEVSE